VNCHQNVLQRPQSAAFPRGTEEEVASEAFERAKQEAMAGYLDPGPNHLNCAQTVIRCALLFLNQDPGLTTIANYLGGGMARMGQLCGALSGCAVALGLKEYLEAKGKAKSSPVTFDWLQQLTRDFQAQFGALACKDLLGCDISTPEGFREAKKCGATKSCPSFVSWTCDRLAERIDPAVNASQ
jgi:C_GCAxxG_C_C family probable redox protein